MVASAVVSFVTDGTTRLGDRRVVSDKRSEERRALLCSRVPMRGLPGQSIGLKECIALRSLTDIYGPYTRNGCSCHLADLLSCNAPSSLLVLIVYIHE